MSNMVVATNVLALNSHRSLKQVGNKQAKASARLSSGYRINSAADDAAGLAISEKMRSQIRGLDQASKNSQDAISLIQTAEGGMQEIDNMIQRIRELTVQVSNDTQENNKLGTGDRQKIQDEIDQLTAEIDSMAERVEFNKKKVINGSFSDPLEMLQSANTKYAVSQVDLANAKTKLATASTNRDNTTSDFDLVKTAVDKYEVEKSKIVNTLDSAKIALEGLVLTPATGSGFNNAAFNDALQAAFDQILASDSSKWTSSFLENIFSTHLTDNGGADAFIAKPPISSGNQNANDIASVVVTITKTFDDTAANTKITLSGDAYDGTGNDLGGTGVFSSMQTSLDALVKAVKTVYDAEKNLANFDSATAKNATAGAPPTADGFFNASGGAGAAVLGDISATNLKDSGNKTTVKDGSTYTSSVDLYKAQTQVALAKAKADAEYNAAVKKVEALQEQVDRYNLQIKAATEGINTLNGDNPGLYFQVGANKDQSLQMSIGSVKTDILGIGDGKGNSKIDVVKNTGADITAYLDLLDESLSYVTTERSKLGAAQNRLEYTIKSLDISSENLSAAESRIRDTDMAKEMMNLTQANVLQQAATSMLAQANQAPQSVLQLLQ